ncbi:MAG: hypothetical protein WBD38_09215, partial [Candidatus Dormiibacterota bacterium]
GSALEAAAIESGWILKEYVPEAAQVRKRPDLQAGLIEMGFGASLEELESAAEKLLADQAAIAFEEANAPGGGGPEVAAAAPASESLSAEELAAMWERVGNDMRDWCPAPPGLLQVVEATPAWMESLVRPLALLNPGPLSAAPFRLLVSQTLHAAPADIDGSLRAIWALEFLPAAWQRSGPHLARLLLPAGDAAGLWQAGRLTAPGLAAWRVRDARRELSWRAMLALVAAGLIRGRVDLAAGSELIAAETGMDPETARLQAVHVAAQPLAALTFIAGYRLNGHPDEPPGPPPGASQARVGLLSAGPLPAACLEIVAGYTP